MIILEQIIETYPDDEILRVGEVGDSTYDSAVIGIDTDTMRLIYSVKKTIEIVFKETKLTKADLSEEEISDGITVNDKRMEMAIDHFEYNIRGSKGEGLPIWCEDNFNN